MVGRGLDCVAMVKWVALGSGGVSDDNVDAGEGDDGRLVVTVFGGVD